MSIYKKVQSRRDGAPLDERQMAEKLKPLPTDFVDVTFTEVDASPIVDPDNPFDI